MSKIDRDSQEWISDEALAAINMERILEPDKTHEEIAREILMSSAPMAAKSVAWLSAHASAEQVRLAASKYIIDGVVGGGFKAAGSVDDLLMSLVSQLASNDVEVME